MVADRELKLWAHAAGVAATPLLAAYSAFALLTALGVLTGLEVHAELFALAVGVAGWFHLAGSKYRDTRSQAGTFFLLLAGAALLFLLLTRSLPYLDNAIPLGYDPGIYRYAMETYAEAFPFVWGEAIPNWLKIWGPKGLFLLTSPLLLAGVPPDTILIWGGVALQALLLGAVYYAASSFYDARAGALAAAFFAVSTVQFSGFALELLKNELALVLLLVSLVFLYKEKTWPLVLAAGFLAGVHRPTFLVFALAFGAFFLLKRERWKENLLAGAGIAFITLLFYIDTWEVTLLAVLEQSIQQPSGGRFIGFSDYLFSAVYYAPLAFVGLAVYLRRKELNPLMLASLAVLVLVALEVLFFRRFILHLDLLAVVLSGIGASALLSRAPQLPWKALAVAALLLGGAWQVADLSSKTTPLIGPGELAFISNIPQHTPSGAYVLSTSSAYHPWIMGYSGRNALAPGFFGKVPWNREQTGRFLATTAPESARELLSELPRPLYVFAGAQTRGLSRQKFDDACFAVVAQDHAATLWGVHCT